ncbi:MAG: RNA polymerase sigma factor [Planctomycetaceae bacterium]|nr:RNA polymerase sigma factor [Planctomycetaceae bacterium]
MRASEASLHHADQSAEPAEATSALQMITEEETDWIERSLTGNSAAFASLVKRYQQEVAAQMWRFSRDRNIHEELVQDVFVEVYRSLGSFRFESPLLHWMRKIAVRVGYRYWKAKDRKKEKVSLSQITYDSTEATSDQPKSAEEAGNLLHAMLEQLPPRDRMILTLIYWEEHTVEEAAEVTGWSQSLVKVQAFRARKKLKLLLQEQGTT